MTGIVAWAANSSTSAWSGRANHDRAEKARENERGVARALAARELEVGGGDVEGQPAQLGDADLGADARTRRRLLEDETDRAPREHAELLAACPFDLQLVRKVERERQLFPRPVADAGEAAALERVGDPGHRSLHDGVEKLGVLALGWSAVGVDDEILVAVIRRLEWGTRLDVDEPARRHVLALRRLTQVHRQRACQDDERLLLERVPMAATPRARLVPPDVGAGVGEAGALAQLGDVPWRLSRLVSGV